MKIINLNKRCGSESQQRRQVTNIYIKYYIYVYVVKLNYIKILEVKLFTYIYLNYIHTYKHTCKHMQNEEKNHKRFAF